MEKYEIDVSVLLIFFNRPETFSAVFEKVREAKPKRLFLYQDGPREGRTDDILNIKKCRDIAESVDWECEIYRKYQEKNYGCDPSGYIAQKWAFSITDKCIIIEDDIISEKSFFIFCKEMLDKYENDNRICRISGMNHLGRYKNKKYDYFYSFSGSIWGWATWKRVVDSLDPSYSFFDDSNKMSLLKKNCKEFGVDYNNFIETCRRHKESGREHFESIHYSYRLLNKMLTIIPTVNLISNIGITSESTHATSNLRKMPKGIQRVFYMKTYDLHFPLREPGFFVNDKKYSKKVNRIMGNNPFVRFFRRIESKIRRTIYK